MQANQGSTLRYLHKRPLDTQETPRFSDER